MSLRDGDVTWAFRSPCQPPSVKSIYQDVPFWTTPPVEKDPSASGQSPILVMPQFVALDHIEPFGFIRLQSLESQSLKNPKPIFSAFSFTHNLHRTVNKPLCQYDAMLKPKICINSPEVCWYNGTILETAKLCFLHCSREYQQIEPI